MSEASGKIAMTALVTMELTSLSRTGLRNWQGMTHHGRYLYGGAMRFTLKLNLLDRVLRLTLFSEQKNRLLFGFKPYCHLQN